MTTLNVKVKKATKAEAYKMALALKKGDVLTPDQIDSMLLHFAPKTNDKAKTAMEWVAKATAANDPRKQLHYIHVSAGVAYASDGCISHRADTKEADGYYCPKTLLRVNLDLPPINIARIYAAMPGALQIKTKLSSAEAVGIRPKQGNIVRVTSNSFEGGAGVEDINSLFVERQLIAAANNNPDPSFWLQAAGNKMDGSPRYRAYGSSEFGDWLVMPLND